MLINLFPAQILVRNQRSKHRRPIPGRGRRMQRLSGQAAVLSQEQARTQREPSALPRHHRRRCGLRPFEPRGTTIARAPHHSRRQLLPHQRTSPLDPLPNLGCGRSQSRSPVASNYPQPAAPHRPLETDHRSADIRNKTTGTPPRRGHPTKRNHRHHAKRRRVTRRATGQT